MQHIYIVTYDIRDDKRLRKVFKTCMGYGDHLQLSVFRCELSRSNLIRLKTALAAIINHHVDQILIFNLGPIDSNRPDMVQYLGQPYTPGDHDAVIV